MIFGSLGLASFLISSLLLLDELKSLRPVCGKEEQCQGMESSGVDTRELEEAWEAGGGGYWARQTLLLRHRST